MDIIRTYGLSKFYKKTAALSDVDITVKRGDIYGLIGKNGAGKTTLMRILCGLTTTSSGSYELFGDSTPDGLTAARAKMGTIVETPVLYLNMTAEENITAMAILRGIPDKRQAVKQSLEFSGLTGIRGKKVKNFSLGMKQRLSLAIALLNRPELLILDEPVNGLDPGGIVEMRNILQDINREFGITMVISSHILTELSHLATTYGILHSGKLIEQTEAPELMKKLVKKLNISLSQKDDIPRALNILKEKFGITNVAVQGDTLVIADSEEGNLSAEINRQFALSDILIRSISYISADLESYFLSITGGKS